MIEYADAGKGPPVLVVHTPLEDFRTTPPEEQARALPVTRHSLPIRERKKGIQNKATIGASLLRYDMGHLRVPTLLISAEDDLCGSFPNALYTAKHVPGARCIAYPTGGRFLLGHWKEACAEVAGFLSSQSSNEHSVAEEARLLRRSRTSPRMSRGHYFSRLTTISKDVAVVLLYRNCSRADSRLWHGTKVKRWITPGVAITGKNDRLISDEYHLK